MSFEPLGLCPKLLTAIESQGYEKPTPIQEKAIPQVLAGKDVLAGAQTGTGKTASFSLPMLQILGEQEIPEKRLPRALILAPTRELAAQVGESVQQYGRLLNCRSTVVFGGVSIDPQKDRLKRGVDIVIGTPGRLLDLCNQKFLNLSKIQMLVLDEADRMLDMGFIHDIKKVIKLVPKQRQTLFFSATYSKEIKALADTILCDAVSVEVTPENSTVDRIDQSLYHVEKSKKRHLLAHLIKSENWKQVLVFTRTKHGANRLAQQLEKGGLMAAAIHGNKSQSARTKALDAFKKNELRILVATDIAARGIDIDQLPYVVNFDLPMVDEDYVHRIGRTGRAGSTGKAVSLVCDEESKQLRSIEKMIKKSIPVAKAKDFKPTKSSSSTAKPKSESGPAAKAKTKARTSEERQEKTSSKPRAKKMPWWKKKKMAKRPNPVDR